MQTQENLFTIHRINLVVNKLTEPFYLIPFGDIHRFSKLCHVEKWFEFLEWAKNKPNCLFLGMGDYDDLASTSERKAIVSIMGSLHDDTVRTIDEIFRERTEKLYEEIKFMKGKMIGLIEGNHHGELTTGITTTQYLAEMLNCKYLGVSSLIRLSFGFANKCHTKAKIDIWAHHGRGASRGTGGSLNSVEQMAMVGEADIFLMGHDHRKSVALRNKICLTSGEKLDISHKKILMGRTGSFLRGYVPGEPSYVAQAMLTPSDLGVIKIELTPMRFRRKEPVEDYFYIDLHASL